MGTKEIKTCQKKFKKKKNLSTVWAELEPPNNSEK